MRTAPTGLGTTAKEGTIPTKNGGWLLPWRPGQSGNPSGGSSAYLVARSICAKATPDAARKQVELINDPDSRVAFMACQAILERGAGKPRDHSAEDGQPSTIDLSKLTPEERAAFGAILRKVLGLSPG